MTRLKLPPYGRALLERRRGGDHPLEVALIYGREWWAAVGGMPRIALNPEDYTPGVFGWRLFAGIKVVIHDQEVNADERDEKAAPPAFGKFYDLVAEVAAFAAYVVIEWPARSGWPTREAGEFAWCFRWLDLEARRMQWPRWWSDELQRNYSRRFQAWAQDSAAAHGIIEPECAEA